MSPAPTSISGVTSHFVSACGYESLYDAANINRRELEAFQELAQVVLGYTDVENERRVNDGALFNLEEPGEVETWGEASQVASLKLSLVDKKDLDVAA